MSLCDTVVVWYNVLMHKGPNLIGFRFSRLVVIKKSRKIGDNANRWKCKCDCGGSIIARTADLNRGKVKGCGCLATKFGKDNPRFIHGATRPGKRWPEHLAWAGMIQRCYNPKAPKYKDYGARGISVCDSWKNNFLAFFKDMGKRPNGLTLDRINNDGNYDPKNCRWTTRSIQQRNRRCSPKYHHAPSPAETSKKAPINL